MHISREQAYSLLSGAEQVNSRGYSYFKGQATPNAHKNLDAQILGLKEHGLSHAEVAKRLGIHKQTVVKAIARSRR